jgi:hypothetical protein
MWGFQGENKNNNYFSHKVTQRDTKKEEREARRD